MTGYEFHDLLGNLGVFFILATYLLLQLEKIEANSTFTQHLTRWVPRWLSILYCLPST